MMRWKDGQTTEQVAEKLIRNNLLRCYPSISKQYLPISDMTPEEGVDYVLKLKKEGKIIVEFNTVGELFECSIKPQAKF